MSLINQLPQTIQKELKAQSLLKVISGLNNFDEESVMMIAKAAAIGGADMIDIACKPELVETITENLAIPICVSAVQPELFIDSVKAGASMIEIGNYDSFYEKGITFSPDKVLSITKETKQILPNVTLSVTVPHNISLDLQVNLAVQLVKAGADIIQTEGGKSTAPSSPGIQGYFQKSVPTLSTTYAIKQEFVANKFDNPIMSASGLSQMTCPLAIACGASAVGVGSVVNKLDDMLSMIAVIRGLKESLVDSLIPQKIT